MDRSTSKEFKHPNSKQNSRRKSLTISRENIAAAKKRVLAPINSLKMKPKSKTLPRKTLSNGLKPSPTLSNGNTPSPDKCSSQESLPDSPRLRDLSLSLSALRPFNPLLNFQLSNENLYNYEGSSSPSLNEVPENGAYLENTVVTAENDEKESFEDCKAGTHIDNTVSSFYEITDTIGLDDEKIGTTEEKAKNKDTTAEHDENTNSTGVDDQMSGTSEEYVKNKDTTTEEYVENTVTTVTVTVKSKNKILTFIMRFFSCI